jgi:16S rRNA (adenine1518-N6/adenine1519-N6)-dimethyltransferase
MSARSRDLGQNFLRDPNILGVIERASELSTADVVLEVGGGEGVLSKYLAERVGYVHVIELDGRLRGALEDRLAGCENVTVRWGDAMKIELTAIEPKPSKLVANLPYGIAAGLILRTIEELASMRLWVAMVQREVGERMAAGPGSRTYGASSVLAQLECDVTILRAIPRTVFAPKPNVDSVLVRLVRRSGKAAGNRRVEGVGVGGDVRVGGDVGGGRDAGGPGNAWAGVRGLVSGAFAYRRKALARSLELAGQVEGAAGRERVRAALVELGQPGDARAERLAPAEFVALAQALRR